MIEAGVPDFVVTGWFGFIVARQDAAGDRAQGRTRTASPRSAIRR